MAKYIIRGGKKLQGRMRTAGSKNSALVLMGASLLTDEQVILRRVPDLADIRVMRQLLENIGKKIDFQDGVMTITQTDKVNTEAPYELVKQMRASIIVLGPLLSRYGKCRVSLPGGCAFGPRPVDLHIKGMENLGAKISLDHGYIVAEARKLKGAPMILAGEFGSSVLGTDNVMMAGTLAEGETVIESAALEPECADLAKMLVAMGAEIEGIGTAVLKIRGVEKLHGTDFTIMPDRIETATFLIAGAITRGEITVTDCQPAHLTLPLNILKKSGFNIAVGKDNIKVSAGEKLKPFSIKTAPYPGFPTDLQAVFTVLACVINGASSISESIYLDRFSHVLELARMGAEIETKVATISINGGKELSGAPIQASDLRCGAALVLAGLVANNTTEVSRIYHIDRGYELFEEKLRQLGADIGREEE